MGTVWMCLFFGVIGWLMIKFDIPRPPLVLALVLAQLMETSIRQTLLLSFGSLSIFIERPIAATLLALILGSMLIPVIKAIRRGLARR
jgi:putative tricarboxylic transport membrane protein